MEKNIILLLSLIFLLSFSPGCKKDKIKPPALPPPESMTIDFTNFESGKKSSYPLLSKGIDNSNWEFTSVVAGYFSSIIDGPLAVPVYALKQSGDKVPADLGDKQWQWSFSFTLLSVTYKARLTGQIRSSDVQWNMYITREGSGGFPEFLWFDGTSKTDGTGGTWNLRQSYEFDKPLLKIEWTKTGNTVNYIKYTYVRTTDDSGNSDPNNSSYIEYGRTTGIYDSFYNISYFNNLVFAQVNVEWNSVSRIGKVKCFNLFGNNDWHCWDEGLINTTCPL